MGLQRQRLTSNPPHVFSVAEADLRVTMTVAQAAAFFSIGLTRMNTLVQRGEVESYLDGSRRIILVSSCWARIERLQQKKK